MDLNAITIRKDKNHLPEVADPSHDIGALKYVKSIAYASSATGTDTVNTEVLVCLEKELSAEKIAIDFSQSAHLLIKIKDSRSVLFN